MLLTAEEYENMSLEEAASSLGVDPEKGLDAAGAAQRIEEYGYNEVPEKKTPALIQFLRRFWDLTAWMLEFTVILTLVLHKFLDTYMIAALLVLNAVLGFVQERQASNAVETLKEKLRINVRVLRDGAWGVMPARELVPGDIVRVRGGDFVPADLKLLQGDLEVDQAALTGESLPVSRQAGNLVYSGSVVRTGEANALVVLTGARTYFGRTTEMVRLAKPKLHSAAVIAQVVKWLMIMVGVLVAAALAVTVTWHLNVLDLLPLLLILLVSAVPVALPAMFTISMAVGSREMVRRGVLITRLNASEDAARMDTLCVDKTGTITMNQLTVAGVQPLGDYTGDQVILLGALASQEANRDPIDLAFINEARQRSLAGSDYRQTEFVPFDPQTRRTEAVVESGGQSWRVVKGAVNTVAALTGADQAALEKSMAGYADRGYRTMAVAVDRGQGLAVAGLVALYDRPRPDARRLVQELKELGVRVKMLTGDALPIAREVAAEVGLGAGVTRIGEVRDLLTTDPVRAAGLVAESDGFAEIYPEDKFALVKSLQEGHHVVGMTGDGVNDAPALKQAEVGIAVSSATDVAKAAASAVLTGEGLENIVSLIKVGRMIFERILTWIFNKVVKTLQMQVFVIVAFFLTGRFVVSAFDIVLLLLLTDFITITISTDNTRWSPTPNAWNVTHIVKVSGIVGAVGTLESLLLLYLGLGPFGLAAHPGALHTYAFVILFFFGTVKVFVVRERGRFWQSRPSRTLLLTILGDIVLVILLATLGLPGLQAIPLSYTLAVLGACVLFAFTVDDPLKYCLLHRDARA